MTSSRKPGRSLALPVDDPRSIVKDFNKPSLDATRRRANAWARGDIDVIRHSAAMRDNPAFQMAESRLKALWVANAEAALASNTSSFAVLSMKDILNPKGLVAALAAKGYKVERPGASAAPLPGSCAGIQ
ncbi:hypothetical protein IFT64_00540 [Oxalobacteraceae sp. CFBP 8753]|nr:hypothetical protein [Oxalobacteraceae sp. CFBP 8753]